MNQLFGLQHRGVRPFCAPEPSYISHHTSAIIEGVFYNKPQRRWWRRGLKYFIFVEG